MTNQHPESSAYQVLGVSRDASTSALRHAYRQALRRTHPDTGGNPDDFVLVQQAWQQVGTPAARRAYDAAHARTREGASGTATGGAATGATSASSPGAASSPGPAGWTAHRSATGSGRGARAGAASPQGPWDRNGQRIWASGTSKPDSRTSSHARSYGHPGGWSRQRYLTLLREWVGRGVEIADPYDKKLLASAPHEIQLALADAHAEEETAKILSTLGSAYTVWHDVATASGSDAWARDASAPITDPAKLDHLVLGPTGLLLVQSEDWGAKVAPKGRDLASSGLPKGAKPVKELARRAKIVRRWGLRLSAILVVVSNDDLDEAFVPLGRPGSLPRFVLRRSELALHVAAGLPEVGRLSADQAFSMREALKRSVKFV